MIRVLLVDDSLIALHILQNLLSRVEDIQVIGAVTSAKEALELLPSLNPDVVCTDLHMPLMNGLELTQQIMATYPLPILVVSVSVQPSSPNVFHLLEAGAIDVFQKPRDILSINQDKLAQQLASKIRIVAGVHVFRRASIVANTPLPIQIPTLKPNVSPRIVTIGASTGGPQALRTILSALPKSFPIPLICVQHIGADFLPELIRWLSEESPLPVLEAKHGELPHSGVVYFAPSDAHLEFDKAGHFSLSQIPPCDGHRPSATVLMRSAAYHYGASTIGVLLSGMGHDGASGLVEIASVGGVTIAQNEESSVVYGMPQAAVALGVVQHELPLIKIAPTLAVLTHNSYSTKSVK